MSSNNDAPKEQNIDDVLELLKRSYSDGAEQDNGEKQPEVSAATLSDEELKEKLRLQFMAEAEAEAEIDNGDTYLIDEDFLTEAEAEETPAEEGAEIAVTELAPEEDDDLTFDEIEAIEDENDPETEVLEVDEEEDDDLTFDEIEAVEDENDPQTEVLELTEEDNGIIFEGEDEVDGDALPQNDDGGAWELSDTATDVEGSPFDSEDIDLPWYEDDEEKASEYLPAFDEEEKAPHPVGPVTQPEAVTHEEEFVALEEFIEELFTADEETEVPEHETVDPPALVDGSFLDQLFADGAEHTATAESSILDTLAKTEPDGAEISLLLQLGCDDEIIDRYDRESLGKISQEEALKRITEEEERERQKKSAEERILARHEFYKKTRGGLIVRMAVNVLLALVLLLYEGLPAMGVDLPGIMNRADYSAIPYVLIAFSLLIICGITSYKQFWDGLKKLFSPVPNAYSMVALLAFATVIYDISIFFVIKSVPPTFHFVLALSLVLAIVREYLQISAEKKSFEFFFEDMLDPDNDGDRPTKNKFTLCRSEGKGSTAEKMYAGGLDSEKNVYFPMEIDSEIGFFRAVENKSYKADLPMLALVPSIAFSLIAGIFALFVSGQVWAALGALNISLFLTLPVAAVVAGCLPFERLNAGARKNGYAFAGEGSVEDYAEGDAMVFSDLHMFTRCSPAGVNLVLYDSTAKDILLGCLSAVYSEIGGPMSETFAAAKNHRFEGCRITRVAKSGVEAIVGRNYSVLLGNEMFMSRYGIAFPKIALNNAADEVFTLCVSVNGRATARIAVRYSVNEVFEMFVARLAEDGIHCVIETLDPMINSELLARVRPGANTAISIVHLNTEDRAADKANDRARILFDASESELGVSAHGSRFNLVVALSAAKRMRRLRRYCNILSFGLCGVGALIALAAAGLGWISGFNSFLILLWWAIVFGALALLTLRLLPKQERFSFERFKRERAADEER